MKNLSTINKIFVLVCAAMIILLALTVPHESNNSKQEKKNQTVMKQDE